MSIILIEIVAIGPGIVSVRWNIVNGKEMNVGARFELHMIGLLETLSGPFDGSSKGISCGMAIVKDGSWFVVRSLWP